MKFEKLGGPERKLLLTALNFDIEKLFCQFCNEKVAYEKCGIMPPINTSQLATITCNSPLCISTYLEEVKEG